MTADLRMVLHGLRADIEALRRAANNDQKPVALDQQSVGRLSRMDSMQMQAMGKAEDARRAQTLRKIDAALARLDAGEYGDCVRCGDEIAKGRLDKDPATPFCVNCAG
ncbi:MAG: molecular chaperone DnaK [Robiginitomaculum sp.]|nr:MAG: molecular chaperone DnaK [Robiginitomaculum sp.]